MSDEAEDNFLEFMTTYGYIVELPNGRGQLRLTGVTEEEARAIGKALKELDESKAGQKQ